VLRNGKPNGAEPAASSRSGRTPRTKDVPPATAEVLPLRPPGKASAQTAPPGFTDGLVAELAHAIVRLAADNPNLVGQVLHSLGMCGSPAEAAPLLMRKVTYAERIGYSVRTSTS